MSGLDLSEVLEGAIENPTERRAALRLLAQDMPANEALGIVGNEAYRRFVFPQLVDYAAYGEADLDLVREVILAMDREWVLGQIGALVDTILNREDITYWEYGRLAELLELLDSPMLENIVRRAEASDDRDIREVAERFRLHMRG
jgi:hypothetical protein